MDDLEFVFHLRSIATMGIKMLGWEIGVGLG